MHDQHDPETIRQLLLNTHTIAVVGLSDKPHRDSYRVAAYLQSNGYRIIPVNPRIDEVLGEKSYATLKEIPVPIDMVNIFRKPDAVPAIVAEAIKIGADSVWMQLGVGHAGAAEQARNAGLQVIMDRCIMVDHRQLID